MTKACLIVTVFCVCLIALFATFVFLISNINPPEMSEAKYDDDYYLNPIEVPSNQKIGYGLEKVTGEYYDEEQSLINMTKSKKVHKNKDALANKMQKKITKVQTRFKTVTRPIKAAKGMRRSINEEKEKEHNKEAPRSLLLEIKGLAGQPGIEIKLVAEKLKSKASRKYRSSGTKTKTESKMNYVKLDSGNSIREASIVIAENGTFVLNIFANSIDVIGENEIVSYELENKNTPDKNSDEMKTPDSNINKEKHKLSVVDSSLTTKIENIKENVDSNIYTLNLINNFTKPIINITKNTSSKMPTGTLSFEYNVSINNSKKPWEGTPVQGTVPDQTQTITKAKEDISLNTDLEVGTHTTEVVGTESAETNDKNNFSTSLVGLLISEATATLPIGN